MAIFKHFSLFNSLMSLEHHKELYEHLPDDDYITDKEDDFDDEFYEFYDLHHYHHQNYFLCQ